MPSPIDRSNNHECPTHWIAVLFYDGGDSQLISENSSSTKSLLRRSKRLSVSSGKVRDLFVGPWTNCLLPLSLFNGRTSEPLLNFTQIHYALISLPIQINVLFYFKAFIDIVFAYIEIWSAAPVGGTRDNVLHNNNTISLKRLREQQSAVV